MTLLNNNNDVETASDSTSSGFSPVRLLPPILLQMPVSSPVLSPELLAVLLQTGISSAPLHLRMPIPNQVITCISDQPATDQMFPGLSL